MSVHVLKPSAAPYQPPPIPVNEGERLAALRNLFILDTAPEESFDNVTRLAAQALQVPIVLVSLVDENRQWFKSKVGLGASETPRDVSFCGYVVYERQLLSVPDALQDPRFAGNPLVCGAPNVRAYLGIPLKMASGHVLGSLCAIDHQPHPFSEVEVATLTGFARIVEAYLHARELAQHTAGVLQYAAERESLFRATFEQAAVGVVHTSLAGHLLRINQRMCGMLGYSEQELLCKSFVEITHPEDLPQTIAKFRQMMDGATDSYRLEKRFTRKDGSNFWAHLSVSLKRNASDSPDYIITVIEDISEKKAMEADLIRARDSLQEQVAQQTLKLKQSNEALQIQVRQALDIARTLRKTEGRLRAITNNVPAIIGYWNSELKCESANSSYGRLYGLEPAKMVGMTLLELQGQKLYSLNLPHARQALAGLAQHFERCFDLRDGSKIYYDCRYLPDTDEQGQTRGFYVLQTNVTELRLAQLQLEASNAKLHDESETDYLTGLKNRRVFSERAEAAAQVFAQASRPFALILMDLDNFKHINDVFGHDTGDEVLRTVGRLLKRSLRRSDADVAARLGGEEFAVLCTGDLEPASLSQLAERIRGHINETILKTAKGALKFTSSFGIAISQGSDADWRIVYARADAALYEAKAAGKDRVVFGKSYAKGATGRLRALRITPPE